VLAEALPGTLPVLRQFSEGEGPASGEGGYATGQLLAFSRMVQFVFLSSTLGHKATLVSQVVLRNTTRYAF